MAMAASFKPLVKYPSGEMLSPVTQDLALPMVSRNSELKLVSLEDGVPYDPTEYSAVLPSWIEALSRKIDAVEIEKDYATD